MTTKVLGFWGPYRFLSNFVPVQVELDGITFKSVEHAYVAAKTTDPKTRRFIAHTETPGEVKRYGRKINLRPDWDTVKFQVMRGLLIQKFTTAPYEQLLLNTGNAYLEETNTWGDVIWGVCKGVGENNLGKLLMQIRTALQTEARLLATGEEIT